MWQALGIREGPRQNGNIVRETSENIRKRSKKEGRREEKREGERKGGKYKQVMLSSGVCCD